MWIRGNKTFAIEAEVSVGHPAPNPMPSRPPSGALSAQPVQMLKFFLAMARGGVLNTNETDVLLESLALYMLLSRHISDGSDLRLNADFFTRPRYVDFHFTYLMGRMGNALGLLYLEKKGFPWFAHFEDVDSAISAPMGLTGKRPSKRPDFLGANGREVVLLECKGTTADKAWSKGRTSVTQAYKNQIAPWIGARADKVPIDAGYAVISQLRETHNTTILSAYTSPSVKRPGGPPESVIRANYAKWTQLMGGQLWTLSASLSSRERLYGSARLLRKNIAGTSFLFLPGIFSQPFSWLHEIWVGIEEGILKLLVRLVRSTESEDEREAILGRLSQRTQEYTVEVAHRIEQIDAETGDGVARFLDGTIAMMADRFFALPDEGEETIEW